MRLAPHQRGGRQSRARRRCTIETLWRRAAYQAVQIVRKRGGGASRQTSRPGGNQRIYRGEAGHPSVTSSFTPHSTALGAMPIESTRPLTSFRLRGRTAGRPPTDRALAEDPALARAQGAPLRDVGQDLPGSAGGHRLLERSQASLRLVRVPPSSAPPQTRHRRRRACALELPDAPPRCRSFLLAALLAYIRPETGSPPTESLSILGVLAPFLVVTRLGLEPRTH